MSAPLAVLLWPMGCRSDPAPTSAPTSPLFSSGSTAETGSPPVEDCPQCEDGWSCTQDTCDEAGTCTRTALTPCMWPAFDVQMLAYVDSRLLFGQSAAAFAADTQTLWIAGGGGGGSDVLRLVEQEGLWALDTAGGAPAAWVGLAADIEDLVRDPAGDPDVVYVISEGVSSHIAALALSIGGQAQLGPSWEITDFLPPFSGTLGPEGLAFVPDAALAEQGFVSADGQLRQSSGGFGGLFFVGHQNGGWIYVFDLSSEGGIDLVGQYETAHTEISGLAFDEGTGRMYVWHGGINELEIVRLSSSPLGDHRRFDSEYRFSLPSVANIEGIALAPASECGDDGRRRLVLVGDDEQSSAVQLFHDWPLCAP